MSYGEVFKDESVANTIDEIEEQHFLLEVQRDSSSIIAEADAFAKKNAFNLSEKFFDTKKQKELKEFDEKLKNLQLELEELSHES